MIESMNTIDSTDMVRSAVLGTLVADASGMGLHWIYSQGKIASIVKKNDDVAEFLEPDEANYQGVPAFYAHPTKHAGDGSNYGEYIYVLLKAVTEDGFNKGAYIRGFSDYFGVGGGYVGYADGPMRETIYSIATAQKNIEKAVMDADTSLSDERRASAAHYISRYFFEYDLEGLKEMIRNPLRLQEWSKEELAEADDLVDEVRRVVGEIGPDDDQMPALSRSAILAHFYTEHELRSIVERAVRITNNNDDAVAYSVYMARIMRDLYESGRPASSAPRERFRELAQTHSGVLPDKAKELVHEALSIQGLDYRGATKKFGAACHVHMAVPLSVHILANTGSFREANRANIMASGDNCGRAIMVGAVAGALYGIGGKTGIPQGWIERTTMAANARKTDGGRILL